MKALNPDPTALHEEDFIHQFPHHHHYAEVDEARPEWYELAQGFADGGLVDDIKSMAGAVKDEGPGVMLDYLKGIGQTGVGMGKQALAAMPNIGPFPNPMYRPTTAADITSNADKLHKLYTRVRDNPKQVLTDAAQGALSTMQGPHAGAAIGNIVGGALLGSKLPGMGMAEAAPMRWDPATIGREANLIPEHAAIQDALIQRMAADPQGMIDQYRNMKSTQGGRLISVDEARELDPAYRMDRSASAAVHEPLSHLMKYYYADELKRPALPGVENHVSWTAGGTGSGKTTAVKQLMPVDRSQLIYDTNLASLGKEGVNGKIGSGAIGKINQALQAGKTNTINYVHSEPLQALDQALTRARNMELNTVEHSGRTVPLDDHLRTHIGANQTIRQLIDYYKGDPRVKFNIIDNTHGKGNARSISIDDLPFIPQSEYNNLREQATEIIKRRLAEGSISPKIAEGFLGKQ